MTSAGGKSAYISKGRSLESLSFDDERARQLFGIFKDPPEFPRLSAWAKIVHRLWFTRVWVVQELALAADATVVCGRSSIHWDDLMNAITAQDHLNLYLADHERNAYVFILERARLEWSSGIRRGLLSVLFRYRILDSTDPRDKIFGLSALTKAEGSHAQALEPDYNIETNELYCTVARVILERAPDLNILSVPQPLSPTKISNIPSWVPDWTNTRLTAPLGLANYSDINDLAFSASGTSKPMIELGGVKSTSLGAHGHCIDRVAAVGTVLRLQNLPRTNFHGVRIPKCAYVLDDRPKVANLNGSGEDTTNEPVKDAFVQTLTTESTSESSETLREQLHILESDATITRLLRYLPSFLPEWLVDKAVWLAHAVLFYNRSDQMTLDFRIHLSSLADRRVLRTDGGYIGLASALAEVGDEIVVVKGAKVPLVLRAKESSWTLQGDCYARGIMRAEAYRDDQCRQIWIV